MKEEVIIEQILEGDYNRFEYFVQRYSDRVFALIVRVVDSRELAEELTQDAFVKAYGNLRKFRGGSTFSTWLYRIAYNTALSALKSEKRGVMKVDSRTLSNIPDSEVEETLNSDKEEDVERLYRAIAKLNGKERALLTLFYNDDLSVEQISKITSQSPSNVKVKLHRARKKLHLYILNDDGKE